MLRNFNNILQILINIHNGITILRKITPYLFLVFFILLASIIWEYIKFPFNIEINIPGEHYLKNLHNPLNDSVRFLVFIFLPLIIFFITKLIVENRQLKIFYNDLFIKFDNSNERIIGNRDLSFFFKLIFVSVIIQFLCLDFKQYVYQLDTFHEGLWLTASSNAIYTNELWQSSYVGRGLFGNFYNYFIWKITGINSIGMSRLVTLFFMLCNKIFLILISKNLVEKTLLSTNKKNFLFILLSFSLISLINYDLGVSTFYLRLFVLLFFLYALLNFFDHFKKLSISFLGIGLFSSISFFWFVDVGAFVNSIIIVLIVYFLFKKEFTKVFLLMIYVLIGWVFFFLLLPKNEFFAFYSNTINMLSSIEYIQGLIYPTPFFSGDARSTRALLLILCTGVLIINLMFKKNNEISFETKLSLFFLFLIACVSFKTALSRSDTGHIKSGLSFTYIPLFYSILYFFTHQFKTFKFIEKINSTNKSLQIIFLSFLIAVVLFYKDKNISIKNFLNSPKSLKYLVQQNDNKYLDQDYIELINFYKQISKNEKCVQVFTNETAIPYLVKKPTCSKYFFVYISSPENLQRKFLSDLTLKKPTYILYESDVDIYDDPKTRLTIVNNYILDNYTLHQKFKKWTILIINQNV